jgi:Reverse transcriptase (RNA-dependent DNA polymerase)
LIGKYLRGGVVVNGRRTQITKGVPQGGLLSPPLSNILLDDLDKELEKRGHQFCRYADDLIILIKSKRSGDQCLSQRAGAYINQNTVDQDSLSGHGPMISANLLVRTRMQGGVGAGGENPPATRLAAIELDLLN